MTVDEGFLQSDHVSIVRVGARPQHLEFVESGRYLPKAGWKTLRFRHRNVGEVQLEVRQIRPENLEVLALERLGEPISASATSS